ncbi:hypothetical protein [Nitratireductor sp. GCM10026969]|uniref:hypothetical protein n=1 Tax=Nitratireductor sp. GCM10026969 TaxID=3252645 RepID=UPI003623AA2A
MIELLGFPFRARCGDRQRVLLPEDEARHHSVAMLVPQEPLGGCVLVQAEPLRLNL